MTPVPDELDDVAEMTVGDSEGADEELGSWGRVCELSVPKCEVDVGNLEMMMVVETPRLLVVIKVTKEVGGVVDGESDVSRSPEVVTELEMLSVAKGTVGVVGLCGEFGSTTVNVSVLESALARTSGRGSVSSKKNPKISSTPGICITISA